MKHLSALSAIAILALCLVACGEDDPKETPLNNNVDSNSDNNNQTTGTNNNTGATNNSTASTNNSTAGTNNGSTGTNNSTAGTNNNTGGNVCEPNPDYYTAGADDSWDACISDDGEYHRVLENISSASRVAAFEEIADLLWRNSDLGADDFLNAREIYQAEEGLDSRVSRREDEHYPPVSDGMGGTLRCRDEGVPAMDPDRCVGPAQIKPLLLDAFNEGFMGNEPLVQAARIEAGLLWFLYVSTHKEANTCASAAKDCDSTYAYYTGDFDRDGGIGLSGYYRASVPEAHEAVWDGILALRCWRDLDPATLEEEATDLDTQAKAIAQLDEGLLYGFVRLVTQRARGLADKNGADLDAEWAFLQITGGVLDRELSLRDETLAAALRTTLEAGTPDPEGLAAHLEGLEDAFACP